MTQQEKFELLTIEDLEKISETIDKVSAGSSWAKYNPFFLGKSR